MDGPTEDDLCAWSWRRGLLEWKLWDQQRQIYDVVRTINIAGVIVILCARQFGKSFLGTLMAVEDCLRYPGYTIPVVGPTIKQTVDIVHQAMRLIMRDAPPGLIKRSKSETRWYIGDSELVVGGFDTQTATRQRGKRALKIYVEEVVDSNPDQYRESIRSDLGPMLTHSPMPQMIFLTTPPRTPDHPFIVETMPEAKLNGSFFCYTIDDNKKLTPDQYEACVRRSGGRNSIEFRREYLCEIVRDTTIVVITDFDQRRHVGRRQFESEQRYRVAIDWGGVRDLTVALLHTYDYTSDTDVILHEMVFPANTDTEKIVNALRKWEEHFNIEAKIADVPGQLHVDLTAKGYSVQAPMKQDWQAGINYMNTRFSLDKIVISPDCPFLLQSVESGTFNKSKTDFERTLALGHCDGLAALMYGLRSTPRDNPFAAHRPSFIDKLNPYSRTITPDGGLAAAFSPAHGASMFGPGAYRPKRFGSFK